jgi:hypothetical protein
MLIKPLRAGLDWPDRVIVPTRRRAPLETQPPVPRKKSSVRHTRAIQRDRRHSIDAPPPAELAPRRRETLSLPQTLLRRFPWNDLNQ